MGEANPVESHRAELHGVHVLVVDDERFFREAIRDILMAEGVPFHLAEDGSQAIDLAADPRIGVMILDIQLPDQSGLDVLEQLRVTRPELRVIVLSSHTDQEYILDALRLGACDYLAKPIHEEELRLAVRRARESFAVVRDWTHLRARLDHLGDELQRIADLEPGDPIETLHGRMVETAARLLDASKTSLLLRDGDSDTLRVSAALGHKVPLQELDDVAVGEGVAGQVVAKGQAILVSDVEADGRFPLPRPEHYSSPSFVAVPIGGHGAGDTPVGALCATDPESGRVFAQEDLTLLRLLSLAASPRLDDAPVDSEIAVPALDELDEHTDSEAEVARVICDVMSREVEPEPLLRGALRAAAAAVGADLISLYLLDAKSGTLRLESQWEGAGVGDRETLPVGRGLCGAVLATSHPIASDEAFRDPRFEAAVDTDAEGERAPHLIVPLRFRGKALGVTRLFGSDRRLVSPRVAEVLGATLSAAVRNVSLYRSLRDSVDELAEARRAGQV